MRVAARIEAIPPAREECTMSTIKQHRALEAFRAARDRAVELEQADAVATAAGVNRFLLGAAILSGAVMLWALLAGPA